MKTTRRKFIQHSTVGLTAVSLSSTILPPLLADSKGQSPVNTSGEAQKMRNFLEASRAEHTPRYQWDSVKAFSFADAATLKEFPIMSGQWGISNNQLKALGVPDMRSRTILIAPEIEGAQRVEFDVTLLPRPDGRVGDVCIRFNADPETGSFARGYALIAAQYFDQSNVCYRLNIPIARTECSAIIPGKRHHIIVEWRPPEGHFRLYVDDTIVLDAWDRTTPLPPDPTKWIGLSTYGTDMIVENLTISAGTLSPKKRSVIKSKQK